MDQFTVKTTSHGKSDENLGYEHTQAFGSDCEKRIDG
jgi:hypothetical protein